MGMILKASPELDLYCEWSSIVDAPVFVGTYEEILAYLTRSYGECSATEIVSAAARATHSGSSAQSLPLGKWEDSGLMVQDFDNIRMGWLPRAKLAEFLTIYNTDRKAAHALLEVIVEE